ncbi:hypothetical protein Q8F55_007558 [Vanrija albida]|uniref:Uncharacterized protein n=1 Tax=Vanrija albida TaxID=181172 RepID=A0ABR3PTV6_9TREE
MANPPELAILGLLLAVALVLVLGPSKRALDLFTSDNYAASASLTRAETALAAHWAGLVAALIELDATVGEDRQDGFGRRDALLARVEIAARELERVRSALRGERGASDWVELKRSWRDRE